MLTLVVRSSGTIHQITESLTSTIVDSWPSNVTEFFELIKLKIPPDINTVSPALPVTGYKFNAGALILFRHLKSRESP